MSLRLRKVTFYRENSWIPNTKENRKLVKDYLIENVVYYIAATLGSKSWYYPSRNTFSSRRNTKEFQGAPIHSQCLLFDQKDLKQINRIRFQLREKRRLYETSIDVYTRKKPKMIELLKKMEFRKLNVFIKYGLPEFNGSIKIPFGSWHDTGRRKSGELRVLEDFRINTLCSAGTLKFHLKKRRKEARKCQNIWVEDVLLGEKRPRPGDGVKGSGLGVNELLKGVQGLGALEGGSRRLQARTGNSSSSEVITRLSFPALDVLSPENHHSRLYTLFDQKRVESVSSTPEKKKGGGSQPKFSSVYQILAYVINHKNRVTLEAERTDQAIRDVFGGESSFSSEKLVAQIASLINSFEELKGIAEFEESKALELAENAEKKSKVFTQQIEEIQKEIESVYAQSNF